MIIFPCSPSREVIREAVEIFTSWTGEALQEGDCLYRANPCSAEDLAALRVINFNKPDLNDNPLPTEIEFEKSKMEGCQCGKGVVYSGVQIALLLKKGLSVMGVQWGEKPIFFTQDYIATFDNNDLRWHLRYGVFSFPSIISLPGIIEAPARPREYYLLRNHGVPDQMIPDSLRERYLTTGDARIPRILAGILLQVFFFYQNGDPFCRDPFCSLYHAHWQEELLRSQENEPYVLCPLHQNAIHGRSGRWASV